MIFTHHRFRAASARRLLLTLSLACVGGFTTSYAGDDSPTVAGQASTLDEVVVTARKREENLETTPIAITAFSAEALQERGVTTITDIGQFTPNVSFENGSNISGSNSSATLFIRGVGQTDFNLTIDPGVGLYVDGVYVSRSVGALLDTMDLESVEVLRGPQGTLFGKNTIGGAVQLTSKRPGSTPELTVEATAGALNRFDTRSTLNVPISDTLAMRLSVATQSREGYVTRLDDGGHMGNKHQQSFRGVIEWRPTDALTFTLAADGTHALEEALPATLLGVNTMSSFGSFYNFALHGATCFQPPTGFPVPNKPACYNSQWITGNPNTTWAGGGNYSNLDLWGTSLTALWQTEPVTLKSITAYRTLGSEFSYDIDASPLSVSQTSDGYRQNQVSEELQATGSALQDRFQWVAGLFYLKEKGTDRNYLDFSIANFLSGGLVDNDSSAIYGQSTYKISDALSLTVGGRYTDETKRFLPDQYISNDFTGGSLLEDSRCFIQPVPILPPNPACTANPTLNPNGNRILPFAQLSSRTRQFTPALTLDYQVNPDTMVYASYSKGFKSGGFTQRVFPPIPADPAFSPEFVRTYELGVKEEFEHRLRWNSAIFYTDYTNLQLVVNSGIAPQIKNAGKAKIEGAETELEFAATDAIRISAGLGFTDAGYKTVPLSADPVTAESQFPDTPRWTGTLGASDRVWSWSRGSVTVRADGSYKSTTFLDAVNSPELRQGGYALLGASAMYSAEPEKGHGSWSVTLGATNLTDRQFLISGYQDLADAGAVSGAFSPPREWYIRGRVTF